MTDASDSTRSSAPSHQQAVTLHHVADRAGVSLATASRALNGSARSVGKDLRDRVLAAAAELDYVPNLHAQAVARGTSNVVGLLLHDISDPYFSNIAAGVMAVADDEGLIVSLGSTRNNAGRELEYVSMLRAQRARAIILAGSRSTSESETRQLAREVQAFRTNGGRVACVSQARLGTDTVQPDNYEGARALAIELVGLGHRRFAVLAGPRTLLTAKERLDGFRNGLSGVGTLPGDRVVTGPFNRDGGYEAQLRLLPHLDEIDCVFAVNDMMAVGAMAACREHGVRVPEDVAIAGFDDISTLRDVAPTLTTVRLPLEEMGRVAATMVLGAEGESAPRIVGMPGEVVLRGSTVR